MPILRRDDNPRQSDLWLANGRVVLDPQPRPAAVVQLVTAFFGHCPGRRRPERLSRLARERLRALGYPVAGDGSADVAIDGTPLHLRSIAELDDLFPDAKATTTAYASDLAGDRAFLPRALEDYFRAGGTDAIVVVLPEEEEQHAFLPPPWLPPTSDPRELRGLMLLGVLPDVGLVALPDLERLQIAADLADPARVRLPNPEAIFAPCDADLDDDHRERRNHDETIAAPEPLPTLAVLAPVLSFLARFRPDVQCLYTLPYASRYRAFGDVGGQAASAAPLRLDEPSVAFLGEGGGLGEPERQRLQALYPFLRGPRYAVGSPSGLVAGTIARAYTAEGPWVSIAGRALASDARPLGAPSPVQVTDLRERLGVGVLVTTGGELRLDDERSSSAVFARSAEPIRFWGFLRRALEELGNQLVFRADPSDPAPRIALEGFFDALYRRRALAGDSAEDAFTIRASQPAPGAVAYEIALRLAYPLDRMRLGFVNNDGQWTVVPRVEVALA